MESHLTKCCCTGTSIQREKLLEEFFLHITSNASVNYSNQEIKDIQNAVPIMLERIRMRVNRRGIFDIDRIVPSGSMAEQTSLWKYKDRNHMHHLEFDFLSVLKNAIKQCENKSSRKHCQGCITLVKPPVKLERLKQYHNKDELCAENLKEKDVISDLFLQEINYSLTSSCACLSLQCYISQDGFYKILLRPSSVEHNHGCCECTVDMSTGTLHVNTEIDIDQYSLGPDKCSLIFQWISKTKSLLAPADLLLQKPQPISSLPIYVDFLPALESLKPTSPGLGDEHDFFIVPKSCNVCYDETFRSFRDRWRKSWCMAEIQATTLTMSDKHRRCYQIMKYLSKANFGYFLPNYHIKTVVLRHHTTCSDTTDYCVECVMGMFLDLRQAYKTKELLSYQSNLNILKSLYADNIDGFYMNRCESIIDKLRYMSITDSWETFINEFKK